MLTIPLASMCLIAQIGSAVHLVMVRHRICPEHGEVVDAVRQHGLTHGPEWTPSASLRSPAAPRGPHEHDHCLFALERREQLCAGGGPVFARIAAPVRAAPPPAALALAPRAIALYVVAPKSSPPA
ncbi:MAG: hypothetical protein HYY06_17515 [Deltaproteobacteria bacterium]|nr:hypothetical protein [Deltaproteobacteria bacterium]